MEQQQGNGNPETTVDALGVTDIPSDWFWDENNNFWVEEDHQLMSEQGIQVEEKSPCCRDSNQ
jgi:hypothetical protein